MLQKYSIHYPQSNGFFVYALHKAALPLPERIYICDYFCLDKVFALKATSEIMTLILLSLIFNLSSQINVTVYVVVSVY